MGERQRYYWKTVISPAVEVHGHYGAGIATDTENAIDEAIDGALCILTGRVLQRLNLVSVTHSPIRFGDTTCLVVTIVAEAGDRELSEMEPIKGGG